MKRVSVFYLFFLFCFRDGKVTSRSIADGIRQKFTTTKRVVEAEPVIVSHAHAARWLASAAVSVLGHIALSLHVHVGTPRYPISIITLLTPQVATG